VLARFQRIAAIEQVLDRHRLQHHSRRLLLAYAVGQLHDPDRRDDPNVCVGTDGAAGVGHAIAGFHVAHIGPDLLDHARRLRPDAARQRQRIEAGALVDVLVVEADRLVTNEDLAGTGVGDLDGLELEHLGAAGSGKADDSRGRGHGSGSW
jgi:hypothetical protein